MNYKILQLDVKHPLAFNPYDKEALYKLEDYELVYIGEIKDEEDDMMTLETLYQIFNINKPNNYKARSVSVSDIIILDDRIYLCDSFGWIRLK